jgi:hypothetical protein
MRKSATNSDNSKSVEGTILQLYPQFWLIEDKKGLIHRIQISNNTNVQGKFRTGDRIRLKVSNNLVANFVAHFRVQKLMSSKPFAHILGMKNRIKRLHDPLIFQLPSAEYDGMPITCEEDGHGQLVRATAVDKSGLQRQLVIERLWATQSDPQVILTYTENYAIKYVINMSISRDFQITLVISDDFRSAEYHFYIERNKANPPAYIGIYGSVFQQKGAVNELWFQGTYKNGVLDVDIDPHTYFANAIARASYFGPLVKERSTIATDPLQDSKNQQILQSDFGTKEWAEVAVVSMLAMVTRVGCSAWDAWPWGTGLCGLVIVSSAISGVLAKSTYLTTLPSNNPPSNPVPTPTPAPPTNITPSLGNEPPPYPFPDSCPGGCLFGQVCIFGHCVDITGNPGVWGPGYQ